MRIREEARRLFEAAGTQAPFHPGVGSEFEVDGRLRELGPMPRDLCWSIHRKGAA